MSIYYLFVGYRVLLCISNSLSFLVILFKCSIFIYFLVLFLILIYQLLIRVFIFSLQFFFRQVHQARYILKLYCNMHICSCSIVLCHLILFCHILRMLLHLCFGSYLASISFLPFIFNLFTSLYFKCISSRLNTVESFVLIQSALLSFL